MSILENPAFERAEDVIDCDDDLLFDLEAYALEDILHEVRALGTDPDLLPFSFASDYDVLIWALALLCESPMGRTYAFDARFEDWSIELDEVEDGRHIVDPQMRVLIMPRFVPSAAALGRSPYFRHMFLVELCRGLRSIWNHDTGVRHGFDLTINQQILWNRLLQADHDLNALSIAWEVREAGFPELWRHMIGSDLGDLAVAFSATIERHTAGIETPQIMRNLFLQWMEHDTYLNAVDHRTLERLDDQLNSPGSGRAYGIDRISPSDVIRLTELPQDIAYLESLATLTISDPFFARMPDMVNKTHLDHILSDITAQTVVKAGFRDKDLASRIFPDLATMKIDTLA